MNHPKGKKRSKPGARSETRGREWVGGRVISPFFITEGTPYRPELTLWLELPESRVVSFVVSEPETIQPFGDTLLRAMESPLVGAPRRPRFVRVADERLAAEVRRVLPEAGVIVAPTPELDEAVDLFAESAMEDYEGPPPSYFEEGRVGRESIERLFSYAKTLFELAPWKVIEDQQILRVDIPELGIEAACLSIIGAMDESLGFVLFPSLEGFERFLETDPSAQPGSTLDIGTSMLVLNFEEGSELPPSMFREALEHGWPVANSKAYPILMHRERDGVVHPTTEREVNIVSACAASLARFFQEHREHFARDVLEDPVCQSYRVDDHVEVRFTLPYEAGEHFEVNKLPRVPGALSFDEPGEPIASRATEAHRNAPYPRGSGKKHQHCCPAAAQPASDESAPSPAHELDGSLVPRMERFGHDRFGQEWIVRSMEASRDPSAQRAFLGPWAFYHHPVRGKPLVQWFLKAHAAELSSRERAWLHAQESAWLSVWEVLDVEPGKSIHLRDLLTGELRRVWETAASELVVKRDAILARIVDFEGGSVLCGVHSRPLPPWYASTVVEAIRFRLRRKSDLPIDRIRPHAIGLLLIALWEETVEAVEHDARQPRKFTNTDGDALLLTVDHFSFDPSARAEIQRRLAAAKEVKHPPEANDPEQVYIFSKPSKPGNESWGNTITGRGVLSRDTLRVETNSVERADALRKRLETLLAPLIRHKIRVHTDPMALVKESEGQSETEGETEGLIASGAAPSMPAPPEMSDQVILEMKTRHYANWSDIPLPALKGKTPRAAVRTKSGRKRVDLLLKECENMESRLPAGQRYDWGHIRRELGLDE